MYPTPGGGGLALGPGDPGQAGVVYRAGSGGNRLELYFDLPWYVSQPMRVSIDLADEATLMQRLEAHARSLPGFKPRSEWRAEMARRMGVEQGAKH
jgi:hypothetical protein